MKKLTLFVHVVCGNMFWEMLPWLKVGKVAQNMDPQINLNLSLISYEVTGISVILL